MTTLAGPCSLFPALPSSITHLLDSAGLACTAAYALRRMMDDPSCAPGRVVVTRALAERWGTLVERNGGVVATFTTGILVGLAREDGTLAFLPWPMQVRGMQPLPVIAGALRTLGLEEVLAALPTIATSWDDVAQGGWMAGWHPYADGIRTPFAQPWMHNAPAIDQAFCDLLIHRLSAMGVASFSFYAILKGASFDHHGDSIAPSSTISTQLFVDDPTKHTHACVKRAVDTLFSAYLAGAPSAFFTNTYPDASQHRSNGMRPMVARPLLMLSARDVTDNRPSYHRLLAHRALLPTSVVQAIDAIGTVPPPLR